MTPSLFKSMLIEAIDKLEPDWARSGLGVTTDANTGQRVTHRKWADNIFILAKKKTRTLNNLCSGLFGSEAFTLKQICQKPKKHLLTKMALEIANVTDVNFKFEHVPSIFRAILPLFLCLLG